MQGFRGGFFSGLTGQSSGRWIGKRADRQAGGPAHWPAGRRVCACVCWGGQACGGRWAGGWVGGRRSCSHASRVAGRCPTRTSLGVVRPAPAMEDQRGKEKNEKMNVLEGEEQEKRDDPTSRGQEPAASNTKKQNEDEKNTSSESDSTMSLAWSPSPDFCEQCPGMAEWKQERDERRKRRAEAIATGAKRKRERSRRPEPRT